MPNECCIITFPPQARASGHHNTQDKTDINSLAQFSNWSFHWLFPTVNLLILLLLSSVNISNQSFLCEQIRKRHGKHCLTLKRGYKCKQNKMAKSQLQNSIKFYKNQCNWMSLFM